MTVTTITGELAALQQSDWTLRTGARESVLVAVRGERRLYATRGDRRSEHELVVRAFGKTAKERDSDLMTTKGGT